MNRGTTRFLLYDEECPVCRASARVILRLAPGSSIQAVGLRTSLAARLVPGESLPERLEAFHLVEPGRRHWKGAEAIPPLLELIRLRPLADTLRWSPRLFGATARAYRWVTLNRGRLAPFVPRSWSRPLPEPPQDPPL